MDNRNLLRSVLVAASAVVASLVFISPAHADDDPPASIHPVYPCLVAPCPPVADFPPLTGTEPANLVPAATLPDTPNPAREPVRGNHFRRHAHHR